MNNPQKKQCSFYLNGLSKYFVNNYVIHKYFQKQFTIRPKNNNNISPCFWPYLQTTQKSENNTHFKSVTNTLKGL